MNASQTILLVEDNPDDEALTLRALRESRLASELAVSHNGADALDYLFARGRHAGRDPDEMPALVLLDLKLPKIDGIEVLRRLRADARTRRVPVVVLTSSTEEQDLSSSYDLGANSYITKPVDFEQLRAAVRQLGLYWLVLNEAPPGVREGADA